MKTLRTPETDRTLHNKAFTSHLLFVKCLIRDGFILPSAETASAIEATLAHLATLPADATVTEATLAITSKVDDLIEADLNAAAR